MQIAIGVGSCQNFQLISNILALLPKICHCLVYRQPCERIFDSKNAKSAIACTLATIQLSTALQTHIFPLACFIYIFV